MIAVVSIFPFVVDALGIGDFLQQRSRIQSYDVNRFSAQADSFRLGLENPLGIGPGHYSGTRSFPETRHPVDSHNLFLKVFVERGWLGFVSFSAILFIAIKCGLDSIKFNPLRAQYSIALLATLAGILANSMFITSLHWRHMFVVIGLLFAGVHIDPALCHWPPTPKPRIFDLNDPVFRC